MATIKLALVDDELMSRNTIKKYLEGNGTYEIAADFQNGKMALEWLRKNSIDILLCDMQMPEMDGVELMRNVHIIDEYLPIIAISSFDDFNYVRGSLINGAANYLLKHEITKENLLYVLGQVREKYHIVPAEKNICCQRGFCIYDKNEFTEENLMRLSSKGIINFHCHNVVPIAIGPDYKLSGGANITEYKQDISKAVLDLLNQILGNQYEYVVYVSKQYHITLLISFAGERSTLFMLNTITNLTGRLKRQILRMLDITVTLVNGEVHKSLKPALEEAGRLADILKDKLYLGGNRIVPAAVAKKLEYSTEEIPGSLWAQLSFELGHQMEESLDTICEILDLIEQKRFQRGKMLWSLKELARLLDSYGFIPEAEMQQAVGPMEEYEEYGQLKAILLELLHQKIQKTKQESQKNYPPQIERAISYINKNYMNDISLEKCAEMIGISYTYLSREFKRATGMRFVEYLNCQRLNKAKSLLIREDIPVKKVAELSGFRNYNYFFKVFKEIEGVTPSEFGAKK